MSDTKLRQLEKRAALSDDDADLVALRRAQVRAGLAQVPEHWRGYVMDPLHLVQLRKEVATVNKRMRKKGALPLELVEAPQAEYRTKVRAEDGRTVRIKVRQVALLGDVPDSGDWSYAARLNHLPSGTIIHRAGAARHLADAELEAFRVAGSVCQHCSKRRKRNDTYVLRNKVTHETIAVGRQCLNKYTNADASASIYAFDSLSKMTELLVEHAALNDSPEAEYGCSALEFVAHANRGMRQHSNRTARGYAGTAQSMALRYGATPAARPQGEYLPSSYPNDDDLMDAADLLALARAELLPQLAAHIAERTAAEEEKRNLDASILMPERDHNVAVILAEDVVSARECGTFAGIYAWQAESTQRAELAELAEQAQALQGDANHAARELAAALSPLGVELAPRGGSIVMTPQALSIILLANGDAASARELARKILGTPTIPEHDGQYLAAVDTSGTWPMRVERTIAYRSGRGYVVKLTYAGAERTYHATMFTSNDELTELGWSRGDDVQVRAQVEKREHYRGTAGVILARATD